MTAFDADFLRHVVDTLLPGLPADAHNPALPAASALQIDAQLADHLQRHLQRATLSFVLSHIA